MPKPISLDDTRPDGPRARRIVRPAMTALAALSLPIPSAPAAVPDAPLPPPALPGLRLSSKPVRGVA